MVLMRPKLWWNSLGSSLNKWGFGCIELKIRYILKTEINFGWSGGNYIIGRLYYHWKSDRKGLLFNTINPSDVINNWIVEITVFFGR